ncbi:hypothetical protein ACFFRR_010734 [Megaselia abdita]
MYLDGVLVKIISTVDLEGNLVGFPRPYLYLSWLTTYGWFSLASKGYSILVYPLPFFSMLFYTAASSNRFPPRQASAGEVFLFFFYHHQGRRINIFWQEQSCPFGVRA